MTSSSEACRIQRAYPSHAFLNWTRTRSVLRGSRMTSLSDSCGGACQGGSGVDVDAVLAGLYELVAPHLTERQRRLLVGAAARAPDRRSCSAYRRP